MHICCTFAYSLDLELLLKDLHGKASIGPDKLFIVPLDRIRPDFHPTMRIVRGDGISRYDVALITGTIGMLLGVIYGYVLTWGPILWALIGLVTGVAIGYGLDAAVHRMWKGKQSTFPSGGRGEVLIIVDCSEDQLSHIETILLQYRPFGFAAVPAT